MDPTSDSRLVRHTVFPKIVYLEALTLFLGANFLFHQHVYRASQNKPHFLAFMLVNAFTSLQLAEATNPAVASYNAAIFNNTLERQHRAILN